MLALVYIFSSCNGIATNGGSSLSDSSAGSSGSAISDMQSKETSSVTQSNESGSPLSETGSSASQSSAVSIHSSLNQSSGSAANTPAPTATKPAQPTAMPVNEYYSSQIGMWYCVWWDSEVKDSYYYEHHWLKETRITPARFGYYATDDIDKLTYDLNYFNKIGIDYLLLDDTNNHAADSGNIASHINSVFKTADSIGAAGSPELAFAGGSPLLNNNEPGMLAEMDIFHAYSVKYPDTYYRWKGKPLFVNFNMPINFKFKDPKDRFTIRNSCGHTSESLSYAAKYNLTATGLYGWVFDTQYLASEVYGINPGWSRSHNDFNWTGPAPKSRENSAKYTRMWLEAIKTNPEQIVVASWNDHAEETGIEAVILKEAIEGREDEYKNPYMYEQITEGYLALKTGYLEGFYYRAENSVQIYRYASKKLSAVSSVPDDKVLIVVPDDYFEWAGISRG